MASLWESDVSEAPGTLGDHVGAGLGLPAGCEKSGLCPADGDRGLQKTSCQARHVGAAEHRARVGGGSVQGSLPGSQITRGRGAGRLPPPREGRESVYRIITSFY